MNFSTNSTLKYRILRMNWPEGLKQGTSDVQSDLHSRAALCRVRKISKRKRAKETERMRERERGKKE